MALRMSTGLRNTLCNQGVVSQLAGTAGTSGAGTANLRIYTGSQPTLADDGTAGTLAGSFGTFLCEIGNIGWVAATSGTASFLSTAGFTGTAYTSGTAGWARLETVNANGTCRIDGDVGTAGTHTFTIDVIDITKDGVVSLLSADIYMAE